LYDGRLCIVTPEADSNQAALVTVKQMWEQAGARVEVMAAAEHDEFLASVSHLPHLAAFALVNAVSKQRADGHDPFRFAAGGFRDFTRIASSSPEMWRDIALCNREALLDQIERYQFELNSLREALLAGDGDRLKNEFAAARDARENWLANMGKV